VNINLTLIGQTITFLVFIAFCAKFIWPALINIMAERENRIAEGLQAADRADKDLELAQKKAAQQLNEAKQKASTIVDQANKRASQIVEEAKEAARTEADRIKTLAEAEVEQQVQRAKEDLRRQVAGLALAGAEQILGSAIDKKAHSAIVDQLANQL
jgi:F-type H+-transporting ATPase subunit b